MIIVNIGEYMNLENDPREKKTSISTYQSIELPFATQHSAFVMNRTNVSTKKWTFLTCTISLVSFIFTKRRSTASDSNSSKFVADRMGKLKLSSDSLSFIRICSS